MSRGQPKKDTSGAGANKPTKAAKANGNGAKFGFEAQMFLAADKLRKNLEPSDYKHVALGLIFLKHISNAFEAKHAQVLAEDPAAAEDPDEYLAENVFWVPKEVPAILIFLGWVRVSVHQRARPFKRRFCVLQKSHLAFPEKIELAPA